MTMLKRQFSSRGVFGLESSGGSSKVILHLVFPESGIRTTGFVWLYTRGDPDLSPRHARKLAQKLVELADRAEKHMKGKSS